jgi:hypothetical protein
MPVIVRMVISDNRYVVSGMTMPPTETLLHFSCEKTLVPSGLPFGASFTAMRA